MTVKPFGVDLTFMPTVTSPDYLGYIKAIMEEADFRKKMTPDMILLPWAAEELKIQFVASRGMADGLSL